MKETEKILSIKGYRVFVMVYQPSEPPKAVIQINHGLAEHCHRYKAFAAFLCSKGYAVFLHDHPGHGQTIRESDDIKGHLPWKNGWDVMLDVIHSINKSIRKAYPGLPVFLLGHSMGSLLSRYYNATYPMYFKGMILSGTGNPPVSSLSPALALVRTIKIFKSNTHKSTWFNKFFYSNFNKTIKNPKTDFDWLSSDNEQVEKYINDPLCGFELTLGFFKNLLQGSLQMLKTEKNLRFRKNFATLIISGKQDPVGDYSKGPEKLQQKYLNQGFFNTQLQLIEGRHELLNEKAEIKEQTFEIIGQWIDDKLKGKF